MKIAIQRFMKWVWYAIATLIILIAVLIGVTRLLTPVFNHHLPDFERWATGSFHTPVTIQQASLSWSGYEPELSFNTVTILDQTQKPLIKIDRLKLNFYFWRSLVHGRPLLETVKVVGVRLSAREEKQGQFNISGLYQVALTDTTLGNTLKTNDILAWIFTQPKLSLQDIVIRFIFINGNNQSLDIDKLVIKNDAQDHAIHGRMVLQQEVPTEMDIDTTWQGKIEDMPHASANINLTLKDVSFPQWLSQENWHHWQIQQGLGSAKVSALWKENDFQSIESEFQLYDLVFNSKDTNQTRHLSRLSGQMKWSREKDNEILTGSDILIDLPNHLWPTIDFSVSMIRDKNHELQPKEISASYIDLNDATDWLLTTKLLPNDYNKLLSQLKPSGEARQVKLNLPLDELIALDNTTLNATLNNASFDRYSDHYPAIKNLSGELNWDKTSGTFKINAHDLVLDYPLIFANSLHFDEAHGQLSAQRNSKKQWLLSANRVSFNNADLECHSDFIMNLSEVPSPRIDLRSNFNVYHAEHLVNYFPIKSFDKEFATWLKTAFISGAVPSGEVILKGALEDFPFDKNNGTFSFNARVKNLEFEFAPGWPIVHKLSGDVALAGRAITGVVDSGVLSGADLSTITFTINNINSPQPTQLLLNGIIDADLSNGMAFIHQSPLENTVGKSMNNMTLSGPMKLALNLTVPLAKPENTKVLGNVSLFNSTLGLPEWNLAIDSLDGQFQFSENSIQGNHLRGEFLNDEIILSFATQKNNKHKMIRAALAGTLNMSSLEDWLGYRSADILNGKTTFQASIDFPSEDQLQPLHLSLQSTLDGITVKAPTPFAKSASDIREFKLDLYSKPNQPVDTKIHYDNLLTAAISGKRVNDQFKLIGGEIRVGPGDANWQRVPGFILTGQLNQLNWKVWKEYFNSLTNTTASTQQNPMAALNLRAVDMSFNQLIFGGVQFNQLHFHLTTLGDYWKIGLANQNMDGQINWPIANPSLPIDANFKFLYFPTAIQSAEKLNPKTIPAFSFVGNDVHYGDKKLGSVVLAVTPYRYGININNFEMRRTAGSLKARGDWTVSTLHDLTRLQGSINTGHLSNFLTDLGFSAANFEGRKANAQFDLNWADAPFSPALDSLSGNVSLDMGAGRIINVGEKAEAQMGLGRMLGIFNLESIPRRLTLDFSDVAQKGYAFDSVKGHFSINKGSAYTEDLTLSGELARVAINGQIGLSEKNYNFIMNITPHVTSSLPLVATVATGFNPLAGVAAYLVDKVVTKEVSGVTTYRYRVTGPWDKPNWDKI